MPRCFLYPPPYFLPFLTDDHIIPCNGTVKLSWTTLNSIIPNPICLHESTVNTNSKAAKNPIQKTPLIPVPISNPSELFTHHPCTLFHLNPRCTGPCCKSFSLINIIICIIIRYFFICTVLKKLDFISEENLVERESSTGGCPSLL